VGVVEEVVSGLDSTIVLAVVLVVVGGVAGLVVAPVVVEVNSAGAITKVNGQLLPFKVRFLLATFDKNLQYCTVSQL